MLLIAEDDEDYFRLMSFILRKELNVERLDHVIDGVELIEYLEKRFNPTDQTAQDQPRMILLDLNMPRKNGLEALIEIRANKNIPPIPIIIYTVSSDPADIIKSYESGANAFITKPVELNELIYTLGSVIRYWSNLEHGLTLSV